MKSDMPAEEHERYEKALRLLEDLRMRGNDKIIGYEEGRFLNVFGKAIGELHAVWEAYYPRYHPSKMAERRKAMLAAGKGYVATGQALIGKDFTP